MSDYHVLADGEEFEVDPEVGLVHACCDCGLVHKIDFEIRDGKVILKFTKDTKQTNKERKRKLKDGSENGITPQ